MDLAQMLVVGGCAVIGASLGVTFWRVSQTGLFKRLASKKKKGDPEESDAVSDDAEDDGIEDAEVIAQDDPIEDAAEGDDDLDPDENTDENQIDDPDLPAEPEDAGEEDLDVPEAEEFSVSFDVSSEEDAPFEVPVKSEDQAHDPPDTEVSDGATGSLEFQEKTALALAEIAERLGDALVRLERLENSVEAQFSGNAPEANASESGILADDIEMSELPIAPAPSDLEPEDVGEAETDQVTESAEIGDQDLEMEAGAEELGESEDDAPMEVAALEDATIEEIDVSQDVEDAPETVETEDHSEEEMEDPLDLPRVIGI